MKLSLITTVLNEEKTILKFIESVFAQSKLPDEIIIADGGSTDNTIAEISGFKFPDNKKYPKIKILVRKGNRSVGRNEAIKSATGEIIAVSDAGCTLDKNWLKNITKPFVDRNIDIVAGYYKPVAKNVFERCLATYTSVMPDKIDSNNFLPSSRSVAFRKSAWKKVKGYPENLSTCEDLIFDKKLKDAGYNFKFEQDAFVFWPQRKNLWQAVKQFFAYARGDGLARYFRATTPYLFARYIFAIYLIMLAFIERSPVLYGFIILLFALYILWSIWKNYKYIQNKQAFIYLPILQLSSDIAVLFGTSLGFLRSLSLNSFSDLIRNNKGVSFVILLYIASMLSVISYGIPNASHPFNYFMDEWHQSQSVRDLFKLGTPNVAGAANGSIFQFFLTGIYLVPFQLLHLVNIFAIKSSVANLQLQTRLFEILRLNTLLFGIGSIILISYLAKKYFKVNPLITALLFTLNPVWLMLSNYFKYDIALMFWSLVAFVFFVRYISKSNFNDYFFAGIFTSLALSTKLLSPLPLFVVYVLIYFIFTQNALKNFRTFLVGIIGVVLTYVFIGNPDVIFGRGSLSDYIYSNLVQSPTLDTQNYIFGMNYKWYFLLKLYPTIFGHVLYGLFCLSLIVGLIIFIKQTKSNKFGLQNLFNLTKRYKLEALTFITFAIFVISFVPIKVGATNNRVLVLLPYVAIMTAIFLQWLLGFSKIKTWKIVITVLLVALLGIQAVESYSWFPIKLFNPPQAIASKWILGNVQKGTTIGIENIPIYQHLPDIILKEFYQKQYGIKANYNFNYQVVSSKTKSLPKVLAITNGELEGRYLRVSDKDILIKKIKAENYQLVKQFKPDFAYYDVFNDEFEYYISGLIQAPNEISIYEKK
jgi:glycosyltransferase involved in cell wall biosynthesis